MFGDPSWPDRYVGVPFADRGRDRDGWDCWGLAVCAYREEEGIELPSYERDYSDALTDAMAIREVFRKESKTWREISSIAYARPGDIMWCEVAGEQTHVGLFVDARRMLHAIERHDTSIIRFRSSLCPIRLTSIHRHSSLFEG